jgi:hypothetical protein
MMEKISDLLISILDIPLEDYFVIQMLGSLELSFTKKLFGLLRFSLRSSCARSEGGHLLSDVFNTAS